MRQLLDDGDSGNIQRVASIGLEGANAALAQNHVVIAAGHDVFRRKQQLFESGGDAALEQHRLLDLAQLAQQIKILHIARAHLQDIHVRQHERDLRNLHDFADHQHVETIARLAQQFKSLFAHTLKRIWRTARFKRAAAQYACSGFGNELSNGKELLARFHRTWAGHDYDFIAANLQSVRKFDDGSPGTKAASRKLVGFADPVNLLYAVQHFEITDIEINARAYRCQHRLP